MLSTPVRAGDEPRYAGRAVVDVLRELQKRDVNIIFSSDLVPATLRVKVEPREREPRRIAAEILSAHGLALQDGPRKTLLVVKMPAASGERSGTPAKPRPREKPAQPAQPATPSAPRSGQDPIEQLRVEERVDVTRQVSEVPRAPSVHGVTAADVRERAGAFDNVFQVMPTLPGIAAVNDEEPKFAVRGAGPEYNLVVFDGVQIHFPQRFGDFPTSFVNPATLSALALDPSGLDARYGSRLSSVMVLETRDGDASRRLATSGSLGLTSGDVIAEGRLPGTQASSWWVSGRGTWYRLARNAFSGEIPGFAEIQSKVTLRPSERTRLSLFGLSARETLMDYQQLRLQDPPVLHDTMKYISHLGSANLRWTPGPRVTSTTTMSAYATDAHDHTGAYVLRDVFDRRITMSDLAVRQRVLFAAAPSHVIDAGVEVHRVRSRWQMTGFTEPDWLRAIGPNTFGGLVDYSGGPIDSRINRTQIGAWLQDHISLGPRFDVEPGVRVDWNSFTGETALQPRLRATTRIGATTIWAGFSAQAQTPSHEAQQGFMFFDLTGPESSALRNERVHQVVAGFARPLGHGFSLRVEGYRRWFDRLLVQRLETSAEREARLSVYEIPPDLPPDSVVLEFRPTQHPESTGRGRAFGLETLLQREGRLSGSIAYTLSRADRELYGRTVLFDFDRTHAMTGTIDYRLTSRIRIATTMQFASGFPFTPLHSDVAFSQLVKIDGTIDPIRRPSRSPDGTLYSSVTRQLLRLPLLNTARLTAYAR
ncbi:MAG TPA: TonB-dependent receptor, partial [Thermoanaerobaculia bacterium]